MKSLLKALGKAQAIMPTVARDGANPFHKSKYATLAETWNTAKEILAKCGLVLTHEVKVGGFNEVTGEQADDLLITHLWHVDSGEHLDTQHRLLCRDKSPQAYGSAITYARRYSLQLLLAMVTGDEDDDGESAQHAYRSAPKPAPQAPPRERTHDFSLHMECIKQLCGELNLAEWKTLNPARQALVTESLKAWYATADQTQSREELTKAFWLHVRNEIERSTLDYNRLDQWLKELF